jgi:hypothetical protein
MKTVFLVAVVFLFTGVVYSQDKPDSTAPPIETTYYDGPANTPIAQGFLLTTGSKNYYEITGKQKFVTTISNPVVLVYKEKKKYRLMIQGIQDPVYAIKLQDVIESNIEGTFSGWDGNTSFKLANGDSWVQDEVKSLFSSTVYRPAVYIYSGADGNYKLKVKGVNETLQVRKK